MFGWSDPSPYFRVKRHGDVNVVHVVGPEIRHPEPAGEFGQDLWKFYQDDSRQDLLVNLEKVRYMSSTGFAVLLKIAEGVKGEGGTMKLCDLHPDVAVGANIIGLGRFVETFPNESEALESF